MTTTLKIRGFQFIDGPFVLVPALGWRTELILFSGVYPQDSNQIPF